MTETCKLLKISFYNDKWSESDFTWVRYKDRLELWARNGVFNFNGYLNNLHIPLLYRPYMKYHLKRGQNILSTKTLLGAKNETD